MKSGTSTPDESINDTFVEFLTSSEKGIGLSQAFVAILREFGVHHVEDLLSFYNVEFDSLVGTMGFDSAKRHIQDIKKVLLFPSYARRHMVTPGNRKFVLHRFNHDAFARMMKKKSVGLNIRLREILENINQDQRDPKDAQSVSTTTTTARKRHPSLWSFVYVARERDAGEASSSSSTTIERLPWQKDDVSHRVHAHRPLSLHVTWDGHRGDSFDCFRAIFEGNLIQQGMGYACHDRFLNYYKKHGDEGVRLFLLDDSVPDTVKGSVPTSFQQIQHDKQYVYGSLRIALRNIQRPVPIIEHLDDCDGFLAWRELRDSFEDPKNIAILKLEDRLNALSLETTDPDDILDYIETMHCCFAELEALGEDYYDEKKQDFLIFGLPPRLFDFCSTVFMDGSKRYEDCYDFLKRHALRGQIEKQRKAKKQQIVLRRILRVIREEDKRKRRRLLDGVRDLLERTSNEVTIDDLKGLYRDLFKIYRRREESFVLPCPNDGFAYQIRQVMRLQRK